MLDRLKRYFCSTTFGDQAKTEVAVWLHTILLILVVAAAVVALLLAAFEPHAGLSVTVVSGLCYLTLLFLVRQGHVRASSILLVLQLLAGTTWAAYTSDSFNAGAVAAYFLVIAISALLLGGNGSLVVALLSILALWGLFLTERQGLVLAYGLPDPIAKTVIISVMLATTALVLRFTIRRLNQALEQARRSETALVQSNQEFAAEVAERQRTEGVLRRRTSQLEALRQLGLEFTAHADFGALLQSIVEQAVVQLDGTWGAINLYQPERNALAPAAVIDPGRTPPDMLIHRGEGLIGRVWEIGESIIVDDYQAWEGQVTVGQDYGVGSIVGVPVSWGDEFFGVLDVAAESPHAFSAADAEFLALFASQAATAIRNTRLYEELRQRVLEQATLREAALALTTTLDRDELIERILAQLQAVVPYDTASVQLLQTQADSETRVSPDPDQGPALRAGQGKRLLRIVGERGFPNPDQIIGLAFDPDQTDNPNRQVVRTGTSFIVDDAPTIYEEFRRDPHAAAGIRSWLGVPMLIGEQMIGMIALDKSEPYFYTQAHARLAEAFAAQAAIAIENSRLFEAEREQRELFAALEQAAAAVGSTLDPDQVLDRILEQVERVVPGDAFVFISIDGHAGRIVRWRSHRHPEVEHQIESLALNVETFANLVKMKQTGKPLIIPDTAADPQWVRVRGWEWICSYVGAPIQVSGSTIGFLAVYGSQPGQFDPADTRRLAAFANHAAAAIQNARLHQALRDHAEKLEQHVEERTAEVQAQYARLDAILRSTTEGIVVTDSGGTITQTNPVARTWLTRTLSPQDAWRLRAAIQDLARQASSVAEPEKMPKLVLELIGLDLELSAAPVTKDPLEEPSAVVVIHDVSHLTTLDRMKTRFVANISHELRTPIATIKLYAYLMQQHPERWTEYLGALAREADHQAHLIEDILQISRLDAGRLEMTLTPTCLDELTRNIVTSHQVLAEAGGLRLEYRLTSPPSIRKKPVQCKGAMALIDPDRIVQVLNNLVGNAIRYTPAGGTVLVSTGTLEAEDRVWATATVSDTGIGVPATEQPHIFDRFFRGDEPREMQVPGTGLGLSIVKEIVELHGGRVTVESEPGVGSTFTVWLPVSD